METLNGAPAAFCKISFTSLPPPFESRSLYSASMISIGDCSDAAEVESFGENSRKCAVFPPLRNTTNLDSSGAKFRATFTEPPEYSHCGAGDISPVAASHISGDFSPSERRRKTPEFCDFKRLEIKNMSAPPPERAVERKPSGVFSAGTIFKSARARAAEFSG